MILVCPALCGCKNCDETAVVSTTDVGLMEATSSSSSHDARDQSEAGWMLADEHSSWTESDCKHPKVERNCRNSWCFIPAGCFVIGAPEGSLGRSMYEENQVPITLTRSFRIQQRVFTYGEWSALGLKTPELNQDGGCREQACPLANINLFEAWFLANLVSERNSPPLPSCYALSDCEGEMGSGLVCKKVAYTPANLYDCRGFRLPTEYEWEYAARAGTKTPFYTGDFAPGTTAEMAGSCDGEKKLDPIAWYCANSGNRIHPVGQKLPNQWGLYDTIGNIFEWTSDHEKARGYGTVPLVDPSGEFVASERRNARGGVFSGWPSLLRVSWPMGQPWWVRGPGVRLVRTGTETPDRLRSVRVDFGGREADSSVLPGTVERSVPTR